MKFWSKKFFFSKRAQNLAEISTTPKFFPSARNQIFRDQKILATFFSPLQACRGQKPRFFGFLKTRFLVPIPLGARAQALGAREFQKKFCKPLLYYIGSFHTKYLVYTTIIREATKLSKFGGGNLTDLRIGFPCCKTRSTRFVIPVCL